MNEIERIDIECDLKDMTENLVDRYNRGLASEKMKDQILRAARLYNYRSLDARHVYEAAMNIALERGEKLYYPSNLITNSNI